MPIRLALILSCILGGNAIAAEVFRWTDENGIVHFSDEAPVGATGVAVLEIEDRNPTDYDPQAHARARAEAWSESFAKRPRASELNDPPRAATPTVQIIYQEPETADDMRYSVFPIAAQRRPVRRVRPQAEAPRRAEVPAALTTLERRAHPARSARRPGADKRFGVLGSRLLEPHVPLPPEQD